MKVDESCYLLRLQYKNECVAQFFTAPSFPDDFEYAKCLCSREKSDANAVGRFSGVPGSPSFSHLGVSTNKPSATVRPFLVMTNPNL